MCFPNMGVQPRKIESRASLIWVVVCVSVLFFFLGGGGGAGNDLHLQKKKHTYQSVFPFFYPWDRERRRKKEQGSQEKK